jgi:thiamine kinase-like enzyme
MRNSLCEWGLSVTEQTFGRVYSFQVVTGGMAQGVRIKVVLDNGRCLFVKMMDTRLVPRAVELMEREWMVNQAIQDQNLAPRLHHLAREGSRIALFFDWVDVADRPLNMTQIRKIFEQLERFQQKCTRFCGSETRQNKDLEHFSVSNKTENALDSVHRIMPKTLQRFDAIEPTLFSHDAYQKACALLDCSGLSKPMWEQHIHTLTEAQTLLHADLRLDNLLFSDEKLYIIDWAWGCLGHPVFDRLTLLNDIMISDACDITRQQAREIAFENIDPELGQTALMQLAGAYHLYALQPDLPEVPGLREFQARQAKGFLEWLQRIPA